MVGQREGERGTTSHFKEKPGKRYLSPVITVNINNDMSR